MIVGIVKSGAAFMVIDKEFPLKRIEYMLNNSECNTVIYNDLGNDEKLEKLKQNNDITFVDYTRNRCFYIRITHTQILRRNRCSCIF